MLGTSRHVCGTTFSLKDYKNWLGQRTRLATPGSYLFTWIQTEPVPAMNDWRSPEGLKPTVIEPEQIRLQVYAAIAPAFAGSDTGIAPVSRGGRAGSGRTAPRHP